ncbi:MAG: hypothetical protein ACAI38_04485 [Myxococcota bacterium]|nr:hypothetical protein [Myxococcota bacterium]
MKRIACAAVSAVLLAIASVALAAGKGELDGKVFAVALAEKANAAKSDNDTLTFQGGTFRSSGCDQYGFGAASYTTSKAGDVITFESTATSPKEGTMIWKGTVKGNAVEGTALWQKKGQADIAYVFKGTLKT